jgi:hypothetical protein
MPLWCFEGYQEPYPLKSVIVNIELNGQPQEKRCPLFLNLDGTINMNTIREYFEMKDYSVGKIEILEVYR